MLIKKYAETATRNTRKTTKIARTKYKRLTHKLHLFIGMDFIHTRVITPLLPWDPTPNVRVFSNKVSLIFTSLLKQADLYRAFE